MTEQEVNSKIMVALTEAMRKIPSGWMVMERSDKVEVHKFDLVWSMVHQEFCAAHGMVGFVEGTCRTTNKWPIVLRKVGEGK